MKFFQKTDDAINFKTYRQSSSKAITEWGRKDEGKSEIPKFEYFENEKNFLVDEVKSILLNYLRVNIC